MNRLVAYHRCLLLYNVIGIRVPRDHSVRETYWRFQRDLPVALLLAIHILSNEKLLNVVPSMKYLCTHRTERINCRNIITTSIAYRLLQTNLNSTLTYYNQESHHLLHAVLASEPSVQGDTSHSSQNTLYKTYIRVTD